jgi:hypothetical protein
MGGMLPTAQPYESKKAPTDRSGARPRRPSKARGAKARQEGKAWQRRMRSLALRRPRGRVRRDRSGAPMKRG